MSTGKKEIDEDVEQWKIRNLIKKLTACRGNGTSMISLLIPPKSQIAYWRRLLTEEYGTASNIKSRVNRLSVLSAITSTQQKLKQFKQVPKNGLCVYCGTIITDLGKEKKVTFAFEPFKPMSAKLYHCDNKFTVEPLRDLLESDSTYGYIIMDGNGCLFGTITGNVKNVLHSFTVELPKKHRRGGQSSVRFARLRVEARHNYVRKCAEIAAKQFIGGEKPNVAGLILAGSAGFKEELRKSDIFDNRLKKIVLQTLDVSYGGENGFNQAIQLSEETLRDVKFVKEKKILQKYMAEVAMDTGKYCFGIDNTLSAFDIGAVDILIVWENLNITRFTVKNPATSEEDYLHLTKQQQSDDSCFKNSKTGVTYDIIKQIPLLEWITENYKSKQAKLSIITGRSQQGSQFVKGFGGLGAILRYQVALDEFEFEDDDAADGGDDFWI